MTLEPLFGASSAIQIHAIAAIAAFGLGVVQLIAPKGTLPHRTLGCIWVILMLAVSGTAFFMHEILATFLLVTSADAIRQYLWNPKRGNGCNTN